MINPKRLLDDLKRLLRRLEADLRERAGTVAELAELLQREYRAAREAGRTGESFEMWREGTLTQAAAAWLLGCVFVRFLEDNGLVEEALLSGPQERRRLAAERQMQYFQRRPTDSDRDYLYDVFRTVQQLPAVTTLFDAQHNPVWAYGISGDAAKELIAFWRQVVPETGELVHDFTDATWNTRFLGDLYQDLSEDARKRFALLQTPEFVEEFILDRTLEPAIAVFGLKDVRLIDPTCGSGHFLLGAFQRLLDRWLRIEPGTAERELVQRALDAVYGVDVNPYAVAIARFRLLVAALQASSSPPCATRRAFVSMWRWAIVCCTGGASMNSTSRVRHGSLDVLKGSGTRMASKTWRSSIAFWGSSTMSWWGIRRTSRSRIGGSTRHTASASRPAIASTRSLCRSLNASSTWRSMAMTRSRPAMSA